jgi:hypothetical protein
VVVQDGSEGRGKEAIHQSCQGDREVRRGARVVAMKMEREDCTLKEKTFCSFVSFPYFNW